MTVNGGNGHILPGTPIAVDYWNIKPNPQLSIFFLSHFHGDHIVGLKSSWSHPIYTSHITAKFLINKLNINPQLVKCLEIGEDHIIPIDIDGHETITVTLFDANHCPGSVMFLFSGYFGDILYTADFRYKEDQFGGFELPPISTLYLDNTYCSPRCFFPTRENAIERILSQLHTCLVQSDRVFLGLDNLGKEELLVQIAKETHCKICVKPSRKLTMDILGLSDIVTTDETNAKIIVVPTNQISGKNVALWNKDKRTHAILATARFCGFNFQPFTKIPNIHVVPYSNHSSYSELKKFVKEVKPSVIIPIVGKHVKGIFGTDISERADMSVFREFLRASEPKELSIPESVKRMMSSQDTHHFSLPLKKRKIARKIFKPFQKPPTVGIRYIVSEDSETDSEPEAVHFQPKLAVPSPPVVISNYSSDSYESEDNAWEVTCVSGRRSSSEDSKTESDPDAVPLQPKLVVPSLPVTVSDCNSDSCESDDSTWEVTSVRGTGSPRVYVVK